MRVGAYCSIAWKAASAFVICSEEIFSSHARPGLGELCCILARGSYLRCMDISSEIWGRRELTLPKANLLSRAPTAVVFCFCDA